MSSETSRFLERGRGARGDENNDSNEDYGTNEHNDINDMNDISDNHEYLQTLKEQMLKKRRARVLVRFTAGVCWAVFALVVFNLVFLPRTSLGRDYRRLHFSRLSKYETLRLYVQYAREDPGELLGSGSVLQAFHQQGFAPQVESYEMVLNEPLVQRLAISSGPGAGLEVHSTLTSLGAANGSLANTKFVFDDDKRKPSKRGKIHFLKNQGLRDVKVRHARAEGAVGVVFYGPQHQDASLLPVSKPEIDCSAHQVRLKHGCDDIAKLPTLFIDEQQAQQFRHHPGSKLNLTSVQHYGPVTLNSTFIEIPGLLKEKIVVGTSSNALALLRVSAALSRLTAKGWKPLRTLILVHFGDHRYGHLLGNRFSQHHHKNVIGFVNIDAFHGQPLVRDNVLLDEFILKQLSLSPFESVHINHTSELTLGNYNAFQYHYGVPSCSVALADEQAGSYAGFLALKMSEEEVISFRFTPFLDQIRAKFELVKHKFNDQEVSVDIIDLKLDKLQQLVDKFDSKVLKLKQSISIDYPWFKVYYKLKLADEIKRTREKALKLYSLFLDSHGSGTDTWFRYLLMRPSAADGELEYLTFLQNGKNLSKFDAVLTRMIKLIK